MAQLASKSPNNQSAVDNILPNNGAKSAESKGLLCNPPGLQTSLLAISGAQRFLTWRAGTDPKNRPGKMAKVPVGPTNRNLFGDWQKTNDHLLTLPQAIEQAHRLVRDYPGHSFGVGVLTNGEVIVHSTKTGKEFYLTGLDLDGVRNPETGAIVTSVQKYIDNLDCYWEPSPSGRGMRGLALTEKTHYLPDTKITTDGRTWGVEVFCNSKWITLTGMGAENIRVLDDAKIEALITKIRPEAANTAIKSSVNPAMTRNDLDRVMAALRADSLKPVGIAENRGAITSAVNFYIEEGVQDDGYVAWWGVIKDLAGAAHTVDASEEEIVFLYGEARRFSEASDGWDADEFEEKWNDPNITHGSIKNLFANAQRLGWRNPGRDIAHQEGEVIVQGERITISADEIQLLQGTLTHDKVALLAESTFINQFLFNHSSGKWMEYTGNVWREDDLGRVPNAMRQLTRIANVGGKVGPQNANFIAGVEKLARNAPVFATTASEFDADVYMLNTPAGAIDLKTGAIRPSTPQDRFSKITSVAPSPEGGATFRKFLDEITLGDIELQRFHQVSLGACLSGGRNGHWLLFWTGDGRNGKNTLGELVSEVFDGYASKIPSSVLMAKVFEGHPTEIAQLQGLRLATASEVEEGCFWHESRLNEITGDRSMKARRMRQDFYEFELSHKHLVYGNHRPQIRNATSALKSRLKIVPFKASFAGREDTSLPNRLRDDAPFVLHWLLEGHKIWMENGQKLPTCKAVEDESREYFESQSTIEVWILERTIEVQNLDSAASSWITGGDLYNDFKNWKQRRGEGAPSNSRFAEMLKGKFPTKRSNGIRYGGVHLRPLYPTQGLFPLDLKTTDEDSDS